MGGRGVAIFELARMAVRSQPGPAPHGQSAQQLILETFVFLFFSAARNFVPEGNQMHALTRAKLNNVVNRTQK